METESEIKSLQNFADTIGMRVKKFYPYDCRRKVTYYLTKDGVSVSPCLDYTGLNNFMLGYLQATENIMKSICPANKKISFK